ncbi:GHKL domain-containing protein [Pseudobutyrivibrio sp. ACV-2]|uniref:ATP-binding protein n=1 Tax=Pseudobutyrivibrio sp. ACV-2 TaxID=1520801 RepID=UPI00089525FF|nr:ATP-binding protein [Pseudobutyrivibrio sp. ACV-2]SDZ76911.1 GHKL domain-containing protein [Pseudobutyrivibrio sp. ACV-2]
MNTTFNIGYLLEMLLPVLGICIVLNKHKHPILKGALCVAIGLIVDMAIIWIFKLLGYEGSEFSDVNSMSNYFVLLIWFMAIWLIVIIGIYIVFEVTFQEALYLFAVSYAIEHIFYCIRELVSFASGSNISDNHPVLYSICLIASFLLAYLWFAKKTVMNGKYLIETLSATGATVIILIVVWFFSLVASFNNIGHIHAIYAILSCLFILINQRAQLINENEKQKFKIKEQLWKDTQIRYQFSKDAMAVVNQHYHDMKHQINALASMENDEKRRGILAEMENDIAVYDAVVRTGNELIDTVLTEKKLICHSKDIQMSCIADGMQLKFMDEIDLYTLLGNALDNAIEANEKISEASKRWISIQIQNKKGIVLVEIINPFTGTIKMKNGMPVTSKTDRLNHGYGTQSIKNIVEKYNGQMIIKTENEKYLLRIIFTD